MKKTLIAMLPVFLAFPFFASGAPKDRSADKKALIEMHEKMAERHKVAAECLKANKPVNECNQKAMQGCPMMKSGGGMCPFMNGMMNGQKGEGAGHMKHPMEGMGGSQKKRKDQQ